MYQTLLVECFLAPRKETLGLIPTQQELGTEVRASNPSTQEVENQKVKVIQPGQITTCLNK